MRGEVTYESTAEAALKINQLNATRANKHQPIYLVLDTPGGSVEAGIAFINAVKHVPNLKTLVMTAASMGAMITQALPGQRLVMDDGQVMFHRAQIGLQGQVGEGEFESRLRMVKRRIEKLEKKAAQRIGITLEQYRANSKDEWWIEGSDAVEQGVSDKIVDVRCDNKLLNKTIVTTVATFFGLAQFKESACPLIQGPIN